MSNTLLSFWNKKIPGIASEKELSKEGLIIQFGIPPNRIDLINTIDGVDFSLVWKNKITEHIKIGTKKVHIYYIGLEELIKNKKIAGRNKDLEDLKYLQKIKRKT